MVNKIIKTTSTDDMNITDINLMQFAGALLMTNKETPGKPTTNRKPGNGPPAWQQRLQKQIDRLRTDLSIIKLQHCYCIKLQGATNFGINNKNLLLVTGQV